MPLLAALGNLGMQAAGGAVGGILGQVFGKENDRRQMENQKELMAKQQEYNVENSQMAQQLQKDMWDYTNYENQKEHLENAGLNAALLYGKGGGGGTTAGQGAVIGSTPTASRGSENVQMAGMGMQVAQQAAQMELIKAQTANVNADTENKKGGIPANLAADTNLKTADAGLRAIQTDIAKADAEIKNATIENSIAIAQATLQKSLQDVETAVRNNSINQETRDEQIAQIKTNLLQSTLENAMIKANTGKSIEETKAIATKLAQEWKSLAIQGKNAAINEQNAITNSFNANINAQINNASKTTQLSVDVLTKIIQAIIFKGIK